jgi:hypothetical protein
MIILPVSAEILSAMAKISRYLGISFPGAHNAPGIM